VCGVALGGWRVEMMKEAGECESFKEERERGREGER
jgi:hypothetical protein